MSSSNCCFLIYIQFSQEAGQVAWYSYLLKNFSQITVIHTVNGLGIVNKAEVDVLLELSCFFDNPVDVGNLISGSSAFSKTRLNSWKFTVHILLKPYCCLGSQNRKKESKMSVAKDKKGKALKNGTKEYLRAGVRTSGETHTPPGQPNLHRVASGSSRQTYKKRKPRLILILEPRKIKASPLGSTCTREGVISFSC